MAARLRRGQAPVLLVANKVDSAAAEPQVADLWSLGWASRWPCPACTDGVGRPARRGRRAPRRPGCRRRRARGPGPGHRRPTQRRQVQPAQPAGRQRRDRRPDPGHDPGHRRHARGAGRPRLPAGRHRRHAALVPAGRGGRLLRLRPQPGGGRPGRRGPAGAGGAGGRGRAGPEGGRPRRRGRLRAGPAGQQVGPHGRRGPPPVRGRPGAQAPLRRLGAAAAGLGPHRAGSGEGLGLVDGVLAERSRRIPTAALNQWLGQATERTPPPPVRGRSVKVRYATQARGRPPELVLFTSGQLPPATAATWSGTCAAPSGSRAPVRLVVRVRRGGGRRGRDILTAVSGPSGPALGTWRSA